MDALLWISQNWFDILSSVGIVGGLLFTAASLRSETRTRRIANLLTITRNHREIWADFSRSPDLQRVLSQRPPTPKTTPTPGEELFVTSVILHLNTVFEATKNGLVIKPEGLRRDVASFFSLPIPNCIWQKAKVLQNDDFVAFVEGCLGWK